MGPDTERRFQVADITKFLLASPAMHDVAANQADVPKAFSYQELLRVTKSYHCVAHHNSVVHPTFSLESDTGTQAQTRSIIVVAANLAQPTSMTPSAATCAKI